MEYVPTILKKWQKCVSFTFFHLDYGVGRRIREVRFTFSDSNTLLTHHVLGLSIFLFLHRNRKGLQGLYWLPYDRRHNCSGHQNYISRRVYPKLEGPTDREEYPGKDHPSFERGTLLLVKLHWRKKGLETSRRNTLWTRKSTREILRVLNFR